MAEATRIEAVGSGRFRVEGDLTFATVSRALGEGQRLFEGAGETIAVDLAGVARADSAGLALLVEWLRTARGGGREIRFEHVPRQMMEMARVSSLDDILPLTHPAQG